MYYFNMCADANEVPEACVSLNKVLYYIKDTYIHDIRYMHIIILHIIIHSYSY